MDATQPWPHTQSTRLVHMYAMRYRCTDETMMVMRCVKSDHDRRRVYEWLEDRSEPRKPNLLNLNRTGVPSNQSIIGE